MTLLEGREEFNMTSRKKPVTFTSVIIAFVLLTGCCHGNDQAANHLLLFDSLPDGFSSQKSTPFDIRSNFSGSVQLVESRDFRVVINITAPTLQQAYDVKAELISHHGGVVLEIKEQKETASAINLTWLFVGIAAATVLVGIFSAGPAIKWYKKEKQKFDFPDHRSYASSSQRGGVYRPGNSIQMVALPPSGGGDHILRGDDSDHMRNIRCDEELRQVPEMPEEEEAEALEMEQLHKLKLQEETDTVETEDSDPQERNLIKSRFHSQAKTVHKDLIKKASGGNKKTVSYKRTQNGMYEGVPTDQEEMSNDETDTMEKKEKMLKEGDAGFVVPNLQVKLDGQTTGSNGKLTTTFGTSVEKPLNVANSKEPAYANDPSESDPMLRVLADVHKTKPAKAEMISISKDKPGNIYVSPSEMKPVPLSTFGPGLTSTPKSSLVSATSTFSTPEEGNGSTTGDDIFQDVAKKYQMDSQFFTPGYSAMGDILEDPREDDQSIVSGSAKSASMYGSSEIFDAGDGTNTYYNLDSDLEVPPLDSEDPLSDGGLPSPMGFPLYKSHEKGKVNDDIKLIPGALKSPGPNTGRLVGLLKPRPYSSIILRSQSAQNSPDINPSSEANVAGASPPLPPPPEEKAQAQPETVFEFPPPPKFYKPPQHIAWREQQKKAQQEQSGDYVQIKQGRNEGSTEETPSTTNGNGGSGGGRGGALNPTYMNLTILSTLCVLTFVSGVYSNLNHQDIRVDITVFAPKHFFANSTRVFFKFDRDTEMMTHKDAHVLVYDVSQPLIDPNPYISRSCLNLTCDHTCDRATGSCVCLKGYKLNQHGRKGECVDVNECMEGKAKCDLAAGCLNRKGSYDCICGEDYYGNGKSCRECKQPCPGKHYEVQPCTPETKKICEACTHTCRSGHYMAQPCSDHENAICRVCQPACVPGEFESRQCTNYHDRECRNVTLLQSPETSSNVILEEKRHIREHSAKLDKLPAHYVGFTRYKLIRGTGITVDLTVRFIDAAQQFLPVNSSGPFNLDLVAPSVLKSYSVQRYCSSPLPDYYILHYNKIENQTFKQNDNGSIEACETHKQYGQFQPLSTGNSNQSFICTQPGSLTNIFNMDESFFLARTKWVDKSKRCQRNSRACETCTRKCGTDMFAGDPICSVTGDGSDNGLSPRLLTCYNCCVKKNCSVDCKEYHKRRCQPEQCSKGNLLEFTLEPSWDSSQDGRFFCHIAPLPRQHLLELDYTVHAEASESPLHTNTILIFGDKEWEKTGVLHHSDGILDIVVNSSLGAVPNLLEGSTAPHTSIFKVGTYKGHGAKLGASAIRPDFVFIRPPAPHAVPAMPDAHQECTHTALNDMILASNMENPYIQDANLEAVANNSVPFTVTNRVKEPLVKATLSKNTPVLKKLFAPTSLDAKSFSGNLTQNTTHWIVHVNGEVKQCPGFLHIALHDPNYPSEVLFDCDTAILCPEPFALTFAVPSGDKQGMFKDVVVVVTDEKKVHNFRIYRRSSVDEDITENEGIKADEEDEPPPAYSIKEEIEDEEEEEELQSKETPDLPLGLPYLLAIGGVIVLLLVLAILGLCFQPEFALPDTPYAQWYHPIFAVVYMMFQFFYSVVVSGTVFYLILTVITSHHVNFVLNHGQSGAVSTASSHIELLQLQRHLEGEISRQDSQADAAQEICIADVKKIVTDMKKLHQSLLKSTEDIFERHRLDLLLTQQKLHVREKLAKDLESFRAAYTKAAQSVLRQVNQNALASFQNVQHNNTWLDGPRFLHEVVMVLMKAHQREQKSFMDWTGIRGDLAKLEIDLSFSLPALPRLDDIPVAPPDQPPIKRAAQGELPEKEPVRSIQIHNNWFFPLEESGVGGASGYQSLSSDDLQAAKNGTSIAFYLFLTMFIICDLILLAHRMCHAWTTAKLILFGFPEYFRERKEDEAGDDDVFESKESKSKLTPVQGCRDSPKCQSIKMFLIQTISTTFLPKIVGAVAACFLLICVLQLSNKYLTVKELGRIGLYHSPDQYLDLQTTMTNARLQTHADYINTVDFPSFQASVSGYISRHRTVLGIYRKHLTGLQNLSAEMYCEHLKAIGIPGNCSEHGETPDKKTLESWDAIATITHACKFHPVVPRLFARTSDDKTPITEMQVEALLESLRHIIYYTSQLIIIYLAVIVLKELACAVLWILTERSGIIRLRIIVEHDQDESAQ